MTRAKPKAKGRLTRLDHRLDFNELMIAILVGFAESADTGSESAGQNNSKDKCEEKDIRKEAAS